ncbi:MAG: Cof-type HAD-IIB family hydrolase [Lachnospiraceae bacterium]|nr:Cof-type HAD-IIB family hydrolase [Lachnospiraceae bacterium]
MGKKAVFFDIDGTLWDEKNDIPESTGTGIRKLRENGHLAFLCTGRSRSFIRGEELFALGFDGIVSGCGTMIEYEDEVLFYEKQEPGLLGRMARLLKKHHVPVIFEGRYGLYLDADDFAGEPYAQRIQREFADAIKPVQEHLDDMEASKFSILTPDDNYLQIMEEAEKYFTPLKHGSFCIEFVPRGYSKATGIAKTCELLGIRQEDTYAFGDSVNDVDMLRYVKHGIVMGNGTDVAKEAGDYITTALHEDGIYHGLERMGLI